MSDLFYRKLSARCLQETAAAHYDWALDYMLDGQLKKAIKHQEIAAEYSQLAMMEMKLFDNKKPA